jgi:hypothetical protein
MMQLYYRTTDKSNMGEINYKKSAKLKTYDLGVYFCMQ